jgi:hypothetical protein
MYLTVIIDLFNRKVVGWSMSDNLTTEGTIISAWAMAVKSMQLQKNSFFIQIENHNMLVMFLQISLKVIMV